MFVSNKMSFSLSKRENCANPRIGFKLFFIKNCFEKGMLVIVVPILSKSKQKNKEEGDV